MKRWQVLALATSPMAGILVVFGPVVLLNSCSSKEEKRVEPREKKPRATSDITEITTPNGKKGVYCKGMRTYDGKSDRLKCYQFTSQICTSGYDYVRESDDAAMLECKPTTGFVE